MSFIHLFQACCELVETRQTGGTRDVWLRNDIFQWHSWIHCPLRSKYTITGKIIGDINVHIPNVNDVQTKTIYTRMFNHSNSIGNVCKNDRLWCVHHVHLEHAKKAQKC